MTRRYAPSEIRRSERSGSRPEAVGRPAARAYTRPARVTRTRALLTRAARLTVQVTFGVLAVLMTLHVTSASTPARPVAPWGPLAPLGPLGPGGPFAPGAPALPAAPVSPLAPGSPF